MRQLFSKAAGLKATLVIDPMQGTATWTFQVQETLDHQPNRQFTLLLSHSTSGRLLVHRDSCSPAAAGLASNI